MKLPNGDRAEIGTKLEDYSLNPTHRDGQHKARVFASLLGITLANRDILAAALRAAAATSSDAEARGDRGFGETFILRFPFLTPRGTATIMSAWIVRRGDDFPRLTTCYIL